MITECNPNAMLLKLGVLGALKLLTLRNCDLTCDFFILKKSQKLLLNAGSRSVTRLNTPNLCVPCQLTMMSTDGAAQLDGEDIKVDFFHLALEIL